MDAWGGILLAYKGSSQVASLQPYVESIFQLLHIISQEPHRSEGLMRSTMGVLG